MEVVLAPTFNEADEGVEVVLEGLFSTPPGQEWTTVYPKRVGKNYAYNSFKGLHIWLVEALFQQRHAAIQSSLVASHVIQDLRNWIGPDSLQPVTIESLEPEDTSLDLRSVPQTTPSARRQDLRFLFACFDSIEALLKRLHEGILILPRYIEQIPQTAETNYPHPDFGHFDSSRDVAAILLLLRHPCIYEAGCDFMFERYMKPAVSLIYAGFDVAYLSETDCYTPYSSTAPPLLVAGGCFELTREVEQSMAKMAQRTLQLLADAHMREQPNSPFPRHFFVYGLHWSSSSVSIFLHFPYILEGRLVRFRQILLAQHYLGIPPLQFDPDRTFPHTRRSFESALLVRRWRLTVALFAIRRHMQLLSSEPVLQKKSLFSQEFALQTPSAHMRITTAKSRIEHPSLCSLWDKPPYKVPECWLLPESGFIWKYRAGVWCYHPIKDPAGCNIRHLSLKYLIPFHGILTPMSDDELDTAHESQDSQAPDFLHHLHLPRVDVVGRLKYVYQKGRADQNHGNNHVKKTTQDSNDSLVDRTEHYLFKAYDFLSMTVDDWRDVNIFIANVFANFSAYAVQWAPKVLLPSEASFSIEPAELWTIPPPELATVDFALCLVPIPPTTNKSIRRATTLPITVSRPAILLGISSTSTAADLTLDLTDDELEEIDNIMKPHLAVIREHIKREHIQRQKQLISPDESTSPNKQVPAHDRFLVCTYLKGAFVHIFSFFPDQEKRCWVDSMPVPLHCDDSDDRLQRFRLLYALWVLQRRVVLECECWRMTYWPEYLLDHEYQLRGNNTPPISAFTNTNQKSDSDVNSDVEESSKDGKNSASGAHIEGLEYSDRDSQASDSGSSDIGSSPESSETCSDGSGEASDSQKASSGEASGSQEASSECSESQEASSDEASDSQETGIDSSYFEAHRKRCSDPLVRSRVSEWAQVVAEEILVEDHWHENKYMWSVSEEARAVDVMRCRPGAERSSLRQVYEMYRSQ